MEHYYIVNINEFGAELDTKINFKYYNFAKEHFDSVKQANIMCVFMHVDECGAETEIENYISE
jgi:hypothetical protein